MPITIDQRPDYEGPLIRVPIPGQPGRFVKMTEAEAIERGLVEPKKREPTKNKMRRPAGNK